MRGPTSGWRSVRELPRYAYDMRPKQSSSVSLGDAPVKYIQQSKLVNVNGVHCRHLGDIMFLELKVSIMQ